MVELMTSINCKQAVVDLFRYRLRSVVFRITRFQDFRDFDDFGVQGIQLFANASILGSVFSSEVRINRMQNTPATVPMFFIHRH